MSKKSRQNPTVEEHYELAASMRNAEEAIFEVIKQSRFLYGHEVDRLAVLLRAMGSIKSRLENTLFQDYPELSNEWLLLYYGSQEEADALLRRHYGGEYNH